MYVPVVGNVVASRKVLLVLIDVDANAVPLGLLIVIVPLVSVTAVAVKLTFRPAVPSKTTNPICPLAPMLPVKEPPVVIRPVNTTLLAVYPDGGTKKSALLTAFPLGVDIET